MGWTLDRESRDNRRVGAELPMRFASAANLDRRVQAVTTNVSCTGLAFVTPVAMPLGTRLEMAVSVPGAEDPVALAGEIVRIKRIDSDDETYEYGVRFDPCPDDECLSYFVRSIDVVPLLESMVKRLATDLYLVAGAQPMMRLDGELTPALQRVLSAGAVAALVRSTLNEEQLRALARNRSLDYAFSVPGQGRWRIHVHYQRGHLEATYNLVDRSIPTLDELDLPASVAERLRDTRGLTLVTGPISSGKSATLAAMVEWLASLAPRVIMTVEQPIEHVHDHGKGIVKQIEVGTDTPSFAEGVACAVRQRPDVLLIGEFRDRATLDLALRAAESGAIVLGALPQHTPLAAIERIAGFYPLDERDHALYLLSASLQQIVSQHLLPRAEGRGRVLAAEILAVNEPMRHAIRTDRRDMIDQLRKAAVGCQSFDLALRTLVQRGSITAEVALQFAHDVPQLQQVLRGITSL